VLLKGGPWQVRGCTSALPSTSLDSICELESLTTPGPGGQAGGASVLAVAMTVLR